MVALQEPLIYLCINFKPYLGDLDDYLGSPAKTKHLQDKGQSTDHLADSFSSLASNELILYQTVGSNGAAANSITWLAAYHHLIDYCNDVPASIDPKREILILDLLGDFLNFINERLRLKRNLGPQFNHLTLPKIISVPDFVLNQTLPELREKVVIVAGWFEFKQLKLIGASKIRNPSLHEILSPLSDCIIYLVDIPVKESRSSKIYQRSTVKSSAYPPVSFSDTNHMESSIQTQDQAQHHTGV